MHSLAKRLASCQNEHNEVRPRLCSAHFDPKGRNAWPEALKVCSSEYLLRRTRG
jgi:hypothetical protein